MLASRKINGIIIHPGEVFSFWRTVGKTSRRKGYCDGRIISGDKLIAGLGGRIVHSGKHHTPACFAQPA